MNQLASALTGLKGERVALCDVSVTAVLQDLLAEVAVSQTYRNDERTNIEAVYTFPLPLDAVLLDLEVEIGERRLKGTVVEKKAAEESYEDAIEAGDAAVMLEAIEPGLYTMNVGNLLSRETATITFRYAVLYRWSGDRLRFFLPTTIAPRFGGSPHLPHQAPEASLTVENQFSLRVEVFGALRGAQFICPSHAVELVKASDKVVLSLTQSKAVMDRDFILTVKAPQATRSFVLCGQDGEGIATLASFQPFFPGLKRPRPLTLAIVIDCSGSMQGDSIEQAKQALDGILEGLQSLDRVTLIAFGSSTNVYSECPLACDTATLAKARRFAASLDANMGGTEIGKALRSAYAVLGVEEPADIFLVTDGEVAEWEAVVDEARKSHHRIFTVGVGSAVSEPFVRGLAAATGGECELVSPSEGMAERVVRHFERMRAPRAKRVAVRWPDGAVNTCPSRIDTVFEGDTVVACARFDQRLGQGAAILEVETEDGETVRQELTFPSAKPSAAAGGLSTVARVVAAARLKELDDVAGLATALRYRLVSPWTNWLVVAPRADEEKAQDLPVLRKVPQTLAAGWGGVGTMTHFSMNALTTLGMRRSSGIVCDRTAAFCLSDAKLPRRAASLGLPEPYRRLLEHIAADAARLDIADARELLTRSGLAPEFDDVFRHATVLGVSDDLISAIILARILGGALREFVSDEMQPALASLRECVREAIDGLREMGRHGVALASLTQEPAAQHALEQRSDGAPERLAQISELLGHIEDAIRRSQERLERPRTAHARRGGGAIFQPQNMSDAACGDKSSK